MRAIAAAVLALGLAQPALAQVPDGPRANPAPKVSTMKIRITIGAKSVEATLLDNASARDFMSMLPMTVSLEDYAATEKIAYLPRKLATTGAPGGSTPRTGDISYYAPWGNLALFYRDFKYSPGLVHLGRIDSGLEALEAAKPQKVTIERIGE